MLILTVKHLSSLLPDSKCWHRSVLNSERYFGWCLPGITRSQCLSSCQRMVLIRTVARCFEQALKYCFSFFSFGVLHKIFCIHLMRKGKLPAIFHLQNHRSEKSFSSAVMAALGQTESTAPLCMAIRLSLPLPCGALSVSKPVTTRFDGWL